MTERQQTHYVGDACDGGRGHRRDCVVCGGTGAELLAPEDEMSDVHEGRAVLMPIPQFLRDDPRCFYAFDPTHPEFGIDSQGRECFAIDVGIAEAVQLLWDAGIKTIGCCDGHGSGDGIIAVATHDDGSPHDGLDDHDPYRPVIHSAERRAVHALKQENRVLRDAAAEALGYLTQLRETSDAFSRMECASRAHAVLDGALSRAGGGADA